MHKVSAEAKRAIIDKVLERDGRTVGEIAKLHNIGYSTLQKWISKVRNGDIIDPVKSVKNNQALSLSERFAYLMSTASLDTDFHRPFKPNNLPLTKFEHLQSA